MNEDQLQPAQFQEEPLQSALTGIAVGNPALYFFMKYWHIISIVFLLGLTVTLSAAAWKYHEYMNEKLASVNVELNLVKANSVIVVDAMEKLKEDVAASVIRSKKFENDLVELRKSNTELRTRVLNLALIPPGTPPAEVQKIIDQLRLDIATKWKAFGVINEQN